LNISIRNIKINSISNVGSLNIGKAVICQNRNHSTSYEAAVDEPVQPEVIAPEVPGVVVPPIVT
jgi:hypothetical protein